MGNRSDACMYVASRIGDVTDAIPLVDAFNFSDSMLNSALGRYDGNVYEVSFSHLALGSGCNLVVTVLPFPWSPFRRSSAGSRRPRPIKSSCQMASRYRFVSPPTCRECLTEQWRLPMRRVVQEYVQPWLNKAVLKAGASEAAARSKL